MLMQARQVEITNPLGNDVLLFQRMTAIEQLGRPFTLELDLLSKNANIKLEQLLGQSITVRLELPHGAKRYFNGVVGRFSQQGTSGDFFVYKALVHPWLWLLQHSADCRIFQKMSVPDIVKKVFRDSGFTDFKESLSKSYPPWEYCVQYRETNFNFVSRLLEQEGIYYYFQHEKDKHTLVLSDSISAHEAAAGYEQIPFYPRVENELRDRDHIFEWTVSQQVQPGAYVLKDYDFTKPKADLKATSVIRREHARPAMEIFDYPGSYSQHELGEAYARARIEALQAEYEQVHGQANARGLAAGNLFCLALHVRQDQNREYLVVAATHHLVSDAYASGAAPASELLYSCSFTAMDSKEPFRPALVTAKPVVQGPQTAVVVGKSGEEIWTDNYGRVKVQFHWDRYGNKDENSSCWVRVSHPWAGKNWGSVAIPRIGQEVIVDFLEGDPDRPIITGKVYNNDNMPPYGLPAGGMVSGLKSNSTPGGGGYNEMSMDDTKGKEKITIHGQYDMGTTVEHDQTLAVNNCRTKTVAVDQSESIGANKTIQVGVNHTETIGSNMSLTVGSNKTETVAINTAETIGVAKELTIGGIYQVTVGAAMNESIGAAKAEEIGAAKSVNVGLSSSENIGRNKSVNAGKDIAYKAGKDVSITSGKKMDYTAGDDFVLDGKKKGTIKIADQLVIKVGKSMIIMKKNGDIIINGKNINTKGSGKITMKAKKILEN